MLSLLLLTSSFLNFIFYIYAIGFVVALGLEQIVRKGGNERDIFIVEYNRKYLWRNTWIINAFWFLTNLGLFFVGIPAGFGVREIIFLFLSNGEVNLSNQLEVIIYIRILYLIVDISYGLFGFLMKNRISK